MSKDGTVKIADMGIGKITDKSIHTKKCAGTFAYMSPELYKNCHDTKGQKYSFSTDIW